MQNSISGVLLILVVVLVLLTIVAIVYLYITAKNKERMALIERGMDPNLARSSFGIQIGIITAGIALGLLSGDIIPGGYGPLFAILFAGAGLIIYNMATRGKLPR